MQNSTISGLLGSRFPTIAFLITISLFGSAFAWAQDGTRVADCAQVVESAPDCLLDIVEQFELPVGGTVPAFLIENLHRHDRIFDHALVLISNMYQEAGDSGGASREREKKLFRTIAETCNVEAYSILAEHFRKLDRDESLFSVLYIANLPICENMTADDLVDLRELLERSGSEAEGLVYLNQHFVAMGYLDGATELAYRLFELYGDSMARAPGVRFAPTAGDAIVLVIGALLSNERVDEALELARYHIDQDWHWAFFQRLVDLRVDPKSAESFLEFADRVDAPAIAKRARDAAVIAHVKLGEMDKALKLYGELDSAPIGGTVISKALARGAYDQTIYALAKELGFEIPNASKKLDGKSREMIKDLAETHKWSELERFIEALPNENAKLKAKQHAALWIIRNNQAGGADVKLAERAIDYFRASYSLVSRKGGHESSFTRDAKWNESAEARQVLEMVEASGLFENEAMKTNKVWSKLFMAYSQDEISLFTSLIDELKNLKEGLLYVPYRFCSDISTQPQSEMCLHALKENWRQGKDGQRECKYFTEFLKFGSFENAVLSLEDIKDSTTRASCALHLWTELI